MKTKKPTLNLSDPLVQVWVRRTTKDKLIKLGLGTMSYTIEQLLDAYKLKRKH